MLPTLFAMDFRDGFEQTACIELCEWRQVSRFHFVSRSDCISDGCAMCVACQWHVVHSHYSFIICTWFFIIMHAGTSFITLNVMVECFYKIARRAHDHFSGFDYFRSCSCNGAERIRFGTFHASTPAATMSTTAASRSVAAVASALAASEFTTVTQNTVGVLERKVLAVASTQAWWLRYFIRGPDDADVPVQFARLPHRCKHLVADLVFGQATLQGLEHGPSTKQQIMDCISTTDSSICAAADFLARKFIWRSGFARYEGGGVLSCQPYWCWTSTWTFIRGIFTRCQAGGQKREQRAKPQQTPAPNPAAIKTGSAQTFVLFVIVEFSFTDVGGDVLFSFIFYDTCFVCLLLQNHAMLAKPFPGLLASKQASAIVSQSLVWSFLVSSFEAYNSTVTFTYGV